MIKWTIWAPTTGCSVIRLLNTVSICRDGHWISDSEALYRYWFWTAGNERRIAWEVGGRQFDRSSCIQSAEYKSIWGVNFSHHLVDNWSVVWRPHDQVKTVLGWEFSGIPWVISKKTVNRAWMITYAIEMGDSALFHLVASKPSDSIW